MGHHLVATCEPVIQETGCCLMELGRPSPLGEQLVDGLMLRSGTACGASNHVSFYTGDVTSKSEGYNYGRTNYAR